MTKNRRRGGSTRGGGGGGPLRKAELARLQEKRQGEQRAAAQMSADIVSYSAESYSGPLPHPATLHAYAELYPAAPEILFESFRRQSEVRHELERALVHGGNRRDNRGQLIAALMGFAGIGAGLLIALEANAVAGGSVIGTVFTVGTVGFIVDGRRMKVDEGD